MEGLEVLSGADIKVFIDDEPIGAVTAFRFTRYSIGCPPDGHLSILLFKDQERERFLGKVVQLRIMAAWSKDEIFTLFDEEVLFQDCETKVSADSLLEEDYYFDAEGDK